MSMGFLLSTCELSDLLQNLSTATFEEGTWNNAENVHIKESTFFMVSHLGLFIMEKYGSERKHVS